MSLFVPVASSLLHSRPSLPSEFAPPLSRAPPLVLLGQSSVPRPNPSPRARLSNGASGVKRAPRRQPKRSSAAWIVVVGGGGGRCISRGRRGWTGSASATRSTSTWTRPSPRRPPRPGDRRVPGATTTASSCPPPSPRAAAPKVTRSPPSLSLPPHDVPSWRIRGCCDAFVWLWSYVGWLSWVGCGLLGEIRHGLMFHPHLSDVVLLL
jgi:hypothetical protein